MCHDTIICIMKGGRPSVVIQRARGCDTVQQRPVTRRRSVVTRAAAHATQRVVHMTGIELRYNFLYHDRGTTALALRYSSMCERHDRCVLRHDPRHDALCATTRRCAHGLGTVRVRLGSFGCAPYALNPVLTQDTVLSHCLDHCS